MQFVTHHGGRITTGSNSFVRFCRGVFRPSARESARDRRKTVDTLTEAELRRALARTLAARGGRPFDPEVEAEVVEQALSDASSSTGPVTPPPVVPAKAPKIAPKRKGKQVVVISARGETPRFAYA